MSEFLFKKFACELFCYGQVVVNTVELSKSLNNNSDKIFKNNRFCLILSFFRIRT